MSVGQLFEMAHSKKYPWIGHLDGTTVAHFDLMKRTVAVQVIESAVEKGEIGPGTVVVETTSGTMGRAYAEVCRLAGVRLALVGDSEIDGELRRELRQLGAELHIVEQASADGSYQAARLDKVAELCARYRDVYLPSQYKRRTAQLAYAPIARDLVERSGVPDVLVATVGTGASLTGLASSLRLVNPDLKVVAVDADTSALFGRQAGELPLTGMGSGLVTGNLDHTAVDDVHWVSSAAAFRATNELFERHAVYAGGSSGAAWMVARWYTTQDPERSVLAIFPDKGHRYAHTVYSAAWREEHGVELEECPPAPLRVDHPDDYPGHWAMLYWGRRSFSRAVGRPRPTDSATERLYWRT